MRRLKMKPSCRPTTEQRTINAIRAASVPRRADAAPLGYKRPLQYQVRQLSPVGEVKQVVRCAFQQLPKGEWPPLLHLSEKCAFWSLPVGGAHLKDPNAIVEDGEWLTVAGRDLARYHRNHRFIGGSQDWKRY